MLIARACLGVGLLIAAPAVPTAVAAESPNRLTTQFVKVETGMTLQYVVQGDPKGPVIVLLHGAGDSWHSWELALPHFPKNYRVYAVTLRGHGLSDHPASGYARSDFAADITSLLKMLDLKNVTLVGHSLGSFVAQVVAQNDVEGRLSRLVLIGSGPGRGRDPNAPSPTSSYFASVKDPVDYQFARDFQSGTAYTPLPPAFLEMMIAEVQRVPAAMFHELGKGVADPQHVEKLARIKAKTLLLWGEKDAMFSKKDQDGLLAVIPGSKLIAYPNTGHALHWEYPERFAANLLAFMGAK